MWRFFAALALWTLVGGCDQVAARAEVRQGNDLYRQGKLRAALAHYREAARIDPDFALTHLHRGYACMALSAGGKDAASKKLSGEAASAFSRYAALRPADPRGPKFYLQVLTEGGRFDDALAFLRARHKQRPRDVETVASLGVVASKAGRFAEALSWYEKRARLLPREARARYLIGTLCWEHLHNDAEISGAERLRIADRGIAALAEATKLQRDYVEAVTYINLLYRERAKAHGDKALERRDLTLADRYHRRALAMQRRRRAGGR